MTMLALRTRLAAACGLALSLVACSDGGGGGSDRPSPQVLYAVPAMRAAPAGPSAVAVGQLDGDAGIELVVAGALDGTLTVYDDGYQQRAAYPVGSDPTAVALGDLDGDGRADVAVTSGADGVVHLLFGRGQQQLDPGQAPLAVGGEPAAVELGDLDGDGELDLVTCDASTGGVSVILNTPGPGRDFEPAATTGFPIPIDAIELADLDGDGVLDLVVMSHLASHVELLLGLGDGSFVSSPGSFGAPGPTGLLVTDVNALVDSLPDLVVSYDGNGSVPPGVRLFTALGSGVFLAPLDVELGPGAPAAPLAVDWDGEGTLDLIVARPGAGEVTVLGGNGLGHYVEADSYALGGAPQGLALHAGELVAITRDPDALVIGVGDPSYPGAAGDPVSMQVVDLDLDGLEDVLLADQLQGVVVLEGLPDGSFVERTTLDMGGLLVAAVAADFDGNGRFGAAATLNGFSGQGTVSVMLDVLWGPILTHLQGTGEARPAAGYLDGDPHVDLVVINAGSDDLEVLFGEGDGSFQQGARYPLGSGPRVVRLAHLNGDAILDAVVANEQSGDVSVLMGFADGSFAPEVRYPASASGAGLIDLDLGDLDGDGLADLVVASRDTPSGAGGLALLLANGDGSFRPAEHVALGGSPLAVRIGDVWPDGRADLLVIDESSLDLRLLVAEKGLGFEAPRSFLAGLWPAALGLADVIGSSAPDALVARAVAGKLAVLETRPPE